MAQIRPNKRTKIIRKRRPTPTIIKKKGARKKPLTRTEFLESCSDEIQKHINGYENTIIDLGQEPVNCTLNHINGTDGTQKWNVVETRDDFGNEYYSETRDNFGNIISRKRIKGFKEKKSKPCSIDEMKQTYTQTCQMCKYPMRVSYKGLAFCSICKTQTKNEIFKSIKKISSEIMNLEMDERDIRHRFQQTSDGREKQRLRVELANKKIEKQNKMKLYDSKYEPASRRSNDNSKSSGWSGITDADSKAYSYFREKEKQAQKELEFEKAELKQPIVVKNPLANMTIYSFRIPPSNGGPFAFYILQDNGEHEGKYLRTDGSGETKTLDQMFYMMNEINKKK